MILDAVKIGSQLVLDLFQAKREEKRAMHERKMADIQNGQEIDVWNTKNSSATWKDEYWTLILSIPAIGAFNPEWVDGIQRGFEALEQMPEWYIASVLASISASFGYRVLQKKRAKDIK